MAALLPISPTSGASSSAASTVKAATDTAMIASNFQTFLTLLTTQLKNQNPMDPLDTNQFTQQLVQFAQVEQQMKSNDQLTTLITQNKMAETATALAYVGQKVVVDGSTAKFENGRADWSFDSPKPATATVVIKDSTGQTAYTGTFGVQAGKNAFTWDGKGNDGKQWPAGNYSLTVSGKDASRNDVAISTEVTAVVDSVDVAKSPPLLSINGKDFTIDKVKRVVRSF